MVSMSEGLSDGFTLVSSIPGDDNTFSLTKQKDTRLTKALVVVKGQIILDRGVKTRSDRYFFAEEMLNTNTLLYKRFYEGNYTHWHKVASIPRVFLGFIQLFGKIPETNFVWQNGCWEGEF